MEDGRRDSPQNPSFLPDGRQFVYVVQRAKLEDDEICVASLESKEPPRCITKLASPARYAEPGYLLFVRDSALRLQPFSLNRLALTGEPTPVGASYVNVDPVYRPPPFSISARTLAFHPGTGISRLTWMGRGFSLAPTGDRRSLGGRQGDQRARVYPAAESDIGGSVCSTVQCCRPDGVSGRHRSSPGLGCPSCAHRDSPNGESLG